MSGKQSVDVGFHILLVDESDIPCGNRYVRKGEKGIVILAPLIGKKKTEEDGEDEEK